MVDNLFISSEVDGRTVRQKEGENTSLPANGEPNSSTDLEEPDGSLKQRRYFGPDGKAEKDIDYKHSNGDGTHSFPHNHKWDWSKASPRQK